MTLDIQSNLVNSSADSQVCYYSKTLADWIAQFVFLFCSYTCILVMGTIFHQNGIHTLGDPDL